MFEQCVGMVILREELRPHDHLALFALVLAQLSVLCTRCAPTCDVCALSPKTRRNY